MCPQGRGVVERDPFCGCAGAQARSPGGPCESKEVTGIKFGGRQIGYARVSTPDQRLDLQRNALEAAGCLRIHEDQGLSGAKTVRPGLENALRALEPGDCLVVWKLDRLGRSLRDLTQTLQTLDERNIGFRSLQDAIDTTTAGGRLYFHILAALAEFERDLISERTKAGMAAAKARGVHVGRPVSVSR